MTEHDRKQLGKTLWNIADQLRGAMNADDFRDYMLAFLFLRYLSDNYEASAQRERTESDATGAAGAVRPMKAVASDCNPCYDAMRSGSGL